MKIVCILVQTPMPKPMAQVFLFMILLCSMLVNSKIISFMVKGSLFTKTKTITQVNGLKEKLKEEVLIIIIRGWFIVGNGPMIKCMDEGKKNGSMEPPLQAFFNKGKNLKASLNGLMAVFIKALSTTTNYKVLEFSLGQMVVHTKVNGKAMLWRAKENFDGEMDKFLLGSTKGILRMARGSWLWLMGLRFRGCGLKGNWMGKVLLWKMERGRKLSGIWGFKLRNDFMLFLENFRIEYHLMSFSKTDVVTYRVHHCQIQTLLIHQFEQIFVDHLRWGHFDAFVESHQIALHFCVGALKHFGELASNRSAQFGNTLVPQNRLRVQDLSQRRFHGLFGIFRRIQVMTVVDDFLNVQFDDFVNWVTIMLLWILFIFRVMSVAIAFSAAAVRYALGLANSLTNNFSWLTPSARSLSILVTISCLSRFSCKEICSDVAAWEPMHPITVLV